MSKKQPNEPESSALDAATLDAILKMVEEPGFDEFLQLLEPYHGRAAQIPVSVLVQLSATAVNFDVVDRGITELLALTAPGGTIVDPRGRYTLLELECIVRTVRKVRELIAVHMQLNAAGGAA